MLKLSYLNLIKTYTYLATNSNFNPYIFTNHYFLYLKKISYIWHHCMVNAKSYRMRQEDWTLIKT